MHASVRWLPIPLAALVLVALVVRGGQDETPPPLEPAEPPPAEVRIPMPEPEPVKTAMEQARGYYTQRLADRTFTLALEEQGRFRLIVARAGQPSREARGTWSLVGTRLSMAYHFVPGNDAISPEKPEVVVNEWRGRAVVLRGAGLPKPVVLEKRTAIRQGPR